MLLFLNSQLKFISRCCFNPRYSSIMKRQTKKSKPAPPSPTSSWSSDFEESPAKKPAKQVFTFSSEFETERNETAKDVIAFNFKKSRIRILSESLHSVTDVCHGILYWMSRDGRVQDNWAMLYAQKLAFKNQCPLHVCFCLVPNFLDATIRHFKFMLGGLKEVESQCNELQIYFHLLIGSPVDCVPDFVTKNTIGAVVCDFSPLRVPMQWVDDVKKKLPDGVPLCQVDAHNIIPIWVTSDKQEYAARTIRPKINKKLEEYLQNFPPVVKHPFGKFKKPKPVNWKDALKSLNVDRTIDEVNWAKPGYIAGVQVLEEFCKKRLQHFNNKRNNPNEDALSNLSPWFHFGQISVQRCILTVNRYNKKKSHKPSVDAFCEEAIVRRELSDNFCFYNAHYDSVKGITGWAIDSLNKHRDDKREYIYSRDELDNSQTHDDLWNSAQIQLVREGKMHGFLRMYWAKKILEWTKSPEEALEFAIYLNDRYSLDGRDPNGYVGCMWSVGGIHDNAWKERDIFGKIRYMNYRGCARKFNIEEFIDTYGGKVYHKEKNSSGNESSS